MQYHFYLEVNPSVKLKCIKCVVWCESAVGFIELPFLLHFQIVYQLSYVLLINTRES